MNDEHPDMGAWDLAGLAVKKIGGRVVNGVVARHVGFDADVVGTLGMVGPAIGGVISDAYRAQPDEPWTQTWGRRVKWTTGLALGAGALAGLGWLGWKYLAKEKDEPEDEE